MCPRSGFRSGGTRERTLVPAFVPGEHPNVPSFRFSIRGNIRQNHPFGKPPSWEPPKRVLLQNRCLRPQTQHLSGTEKQPKHKVLGRDIPGTSGNPDAGISQTQTLCKWPFSVLLDRERQGCPRIWVGTSQIWNIGGPLCLSSKTAPKKLPRKLGRHVCRTKLSPKNVKSMQSMVCKTRKRIRITIRNVSKHFKAPLTPLTKVSHQHFYKSFSPPKICHPPPPKSVWPKPCFR